MKKWTKKFLSRKTTGKETNQKMLSNAKRAEEDIGIPSKLWIELSAKIWRSDLGNAIIKSGVFQTAFIVGFAIGWAEKNRKIK